MSLFRKRRAVEPEPDEDVAGAAAVDEDPADEAADVAEAVEEESQPSGRPERPDGPWDVSEVPDTLEGYIDLGALRLRGRDQMELRLEVDEGAGRVTTAMVQMGGSAVQLQVFAAPRSSGIWDEIRAEIANGVTRQDGTVDDVPGVFGRELVARVPVRTPDGRVVHQPVRFTGVDGPRWFLRAVFHGAAAYKPEEALELESVVRDIVVVRGQEAMAPRELLPLRLPDAPPAPAAQDEESTLDPFRRGPEITEIH